MVDAVVSFAVERLGDLLIQEAVFLYGVRGQVDQLRTELTRMMCFLKDADEKQHLQGEERVRNWVAEIRDVSYDAEDVIDTFILKVASSERRREGIQGFLMRNNPYKIIINKPIRLHKVGTKIGAILARLEDISTSRIKFGIKEVGGTDHGTGEASSSSTSRRSYPHVEDEDVIGLEEPTNKLVAELKKEDEDRRRVISIIGIGGLGKTTLAKKVYNHKDVKTHFDFCAWTFISQQYRSRDVLQQILKKASPATDEEIKNMTEVDLVEKLHSYLKEKRYLVVLDDIWSEEAWDVISPAFPNKGKMGSKVLLTTRYQNVASHADPWSLHLKPRPFTDDEGWELLYRKVFPKNIPANAASKYCSPELEGLGRKMVDKCGGLPLGVSILGGLLVKKDIREWEVVLRDINAYMNKGGRVGGVSAIMSLSYNDLSCDLKPCFLYLGLFPEDYAIPTKKLIRLWMAEGFIQQKKGAGSGGGRTMEEEGEYNLTELIQRCMVQVDKRSLYTGGVRTCRVHDVMRDLCLSKAREVNFLDIYEYDQHRHHDQNLASPTNHMRLRRHAIHYEVSINKVRFDYLKKSTYSHIRTLLAIPRSSFFDFRSKITNWYQNIELLRVLDLESVAVDKNATEQIGKLIHLRYLALRGGNFKMKTSSSIGNLRNLQTLILSHFCGWLPKRIARMEQLRHLHVGSPSPKISKKWLVDNYLVNLQTLKRVSAVGWLTKDCGFEKLTSLRTLKIKELLRSQIEEVILPNIVARSSSSPSSSSSSNNNYNPITSLSLNCQDEEEFPNLEPLSRCHKLLKLRLEGRCSKSKNLLLLSKFPPNLTKLTLSGTSLNQEQMATLQRLPNLKFLRMIKSYSGEEMVCSTQGFPKLQYLQLQYLLHLKEWRVDQGGMPSLKHLGILCCRKLKMLPEGLMFITTLQQLEISWMLEEFEARVERGTGDDWYKIQHIPSISIN